MKKISAFLMAMVLLFNIIIPVSAYAVEALRCPFAETEEGYISVQNGIVEYKVNKENGRFTVNTTEGIPQKNTDNDKNLLFLDKTPDTSFTTFRIDGVDYLFGNSYENGGIIGAPTQFGNITVTVWKINNIEITQTIQLVTDESNPNAGNAKITYTAVATDKVKHSVEARILLDTQLGSNDASPMIVGTTFITNETEFVGENIPAAWKSADERYAPAIIAYGLNRGWENNAPSKMIVAHWENLSATKWDYTPDTYINFTSNKNKFDSADSSVALYYEGYVLQPGKELVFETFYGIGSLVDAAGVTDFTVQVNTPTKLTINDTYSGYNEEVFDVVVTIDNTHVDAYDLNNVIVELGMDSEISFAEGQEQSVVINKIMAGDKLETIFKVVPAVQENVTVAELGVTVLFDGETDREYAEARKYVVLPSIKGIPPKMQMTEVSPETTYTGTLKKTFLIKGSDFDSLKADYEWEMYIQSELDGEKYPIKRKDITITDESISIVVDKGYDFRDGKHNIVLASASYGNMSKTVTFTDDEFFDRKEYGYALVGAFEEDEDGNPVYSIITVDSEEEITDEIEEATLLELKGEIFVRETEDGVIYECGPGTIINDAILYRAPSNEPHKCFTIKRYAAGGVDWWGLVEDSVVVSGTGYLAIGDYTFHYGDFYVAFNDGTTYELTEATDAKEDDDYNPDNPLGEEEGEPVMIITPTGVVAGEVLKAIGMLAGTRIQIYNAVIGKNTISLGGSIGVALPWMSKAADGGDDDKKDDDKKDSKSSAGKAEGGKATSLEDKHEKYDAYNAVESGQKTDDIVSLNLEELRYGVMNDNTSYLVGLKADGGINLTDDAIPKLKAGGVTAGFELNSLDYDGMYAKIAGGFKVGEAFETSAEIALVFETGGSVIPDSVELVMGGEVMKIPLGIVGFLTKIGGGVYNLYDTIKGYYNIIPPVTFKLITGYEDPTTVAFEMDTISLELGLGGFKYEGEEAKIVGLKVIDSVYGKFLVYVYKNPDGSYSPCLDVGVGMEMNMMGILKGSGEIWLVYDPRIESIFGNLSLGGKGYIGVFIPDYIPLVGGEELLGAAAELSTYRMFLGIRVIGIPVSVAYYWDDKKVRFNDDFASLSAELGIPEEELENAFLITGDDVGVDEAGFMMFGSNFRQTYSSKDMAGLMGESSLNEHLVPVNNQDYALFEIQYYDELPEISVIKPDGTSYELVENENMLLQTIDADSSVSGTVEKRVYISVTDPMDGNWTISADCNIDVIANNVLALPELENVDCGMVGNDVSVSWNANNIDDSYCVDVYLSEKQTEEYSISDFVGREDEYYALMSRQDLGICVAKDIPAVDGNVLVEISDVITKGNLCARVVLHKNGESFDSEISESYYTYKNPNVPETPENVVVTNGGDGQFKVTFDEVDNANMYSINLLNADGTPIENYEGVITDKTNAYIGSVMSVPTEYDADMKPVSFAEIGAFPGNEYRVKVFAYNEIDGVMYMSDEYISDVVYLEIPDPANVIVRVDGKDGIEETSERGDTSINAITNNKNATVEYIADQKVYVSYTMDDVGDGTIYEVEAGEALIIPTELIDGGSIMEFVAVNDAGDYTISKVNISYDGVAPELLLNEVNVTSQNGVYTITGTAETNAKVYVSGNNNEIPVVNGEFSYTGFIDGSREEVTFTAVDAAGNETKMSACVVNGDISSFKNIIVKDAYGNEIESLKLYRGEEAEILVFGVDEDGKEHELSDSNVSYTVLYGYDKASVDENGLVVGEYYGDAVILCSYNVTDDYCFEATAEVLVEQKLESAKDIRINTTDIYSNEIGTSVARLSVPDAPIGVTYTYTIEENEYFEISENLIVLKKQLDVDSVDVAVTAVGSHVIDGLYENIGVPFTKTITFNKVKRLLSVVNPDSINVTFNKPFESLELPETVSVQLSDGSTELLPVTWNKGAYNPKVKSTYVVRGDIEISSNIINPENVRAEMIVRISSPSVAAIDKTHTYSIYVSETENGVVKVSSSVVKAGDSVKITCIPDEGYEIASVNINGQKAECITEFTINSVSEDVTIDVLFEKTYVYTNPFVDVKDNDWFADSVRIAYENGLMVGTSEITFEPESAVTRAMFVTVLYRIEGSPEVSANTEFTDIESGFWYENAVIWASENGIVNGVTSEKFAPYSEITREQMATLVYRYLKYKNSPYAEVSEKALGFDDADKISEYALEAIKCCCGLGIINGMGNNLVSPFGTTTRAQAATVFVRLLDFLN